MTLVFNNLSLKFRKLLVTILLVTIGVTLSNNTCFAQSKSNKGKDFWVGYMLHYSGNSAGHSLYITSDSATTGTVSVPGQSWSKTFSITANSVTVVTIPASVVYNSCSDCITTRGVHITAAKDVVVYSHQYLGNQSDATLVLPTRTLGKDYYTMGYIQANATGGTGKNVFAIIAVKDNTKVRITPTQALTKNGGGTLAANTPYEITLDEGELYQGFAASSTPSVSDLTGTHIEVIDTGANANCRTIAVFSGSSYTPINAGCTGGIASGDNLYEQMYATNSWGNRFILVPALGRVSDNFRFVASQDNTEVIVFQAAGAPFSYYINKGEFAQLSDESAIRYVIATKPIMVGQFQKTARCDGNTNSMGDPSMTILNPLEQTLTDITLYSSQYFDIDNHYINVVIPTYAASSFRVDGASASFTAVPKNSSYSYTRLTVSAGNHRLKANAGFIATAYGEGQYESYGYAAGANIKDLTAVAKVTNSAQNNEISNCIGSPTQFAGSAEYSVVKWEWDFGDGTRDSVQNPSHTYTDTGSYTATMYSYKPAFDGCSNFDSSQVEIRIYDVPTAAITKSSLCDSVTATFSEVSTFPSPEQHLTTRWSINDGAYSYGRNFTHLFDTIGKFKLFMEVTSKHNCKASIIDSVVVSPNPVAMFIPKDVCFYDTAYLNSTSTITSGSIASYSWETSDGGGNLDSLNAHYFADSGKYYVSLFVTSDSGCSGFYNDSLYKYPRMDVSFTHNDTCFGNGNIFTNNTSKDGGQYTDTTWYTSALDTAHTYNYGKLFDIVGTYSVTLVMEQDNYCRDSFVRTVDIHPLVVPDFSFSNTCFGDTTVFTDASTISNGTYTVNWTDGAGGSFSNPYKTKYNSAGIKTMTLTVTSDNGCITDTTKQITITNPQIIKLNKADGCAGTVQQISSTNSMGLDSFAQYEWKINGATASTDSLFSNLRNGKGVKKILLEVTSKNGCKISKLDSFTVFEAPKAAFNVTEVCTKQNLLPTDMSTITSPSTIDNHKWYVNGVLTSVDQNPTITTTSYGTKTIKLITTSNNNCKDSISKNVEVRPLPVGGFNFSNTCFGELTQFTSNASIPAGTISSTTWKIDNSNFTGLAPSYTFPAAATYNVSQVTLSNYGCKDSIAKEVIINPLPVIDISLNSYIGCEPFDVMVINNSTVASGVISDYLWTWGDGQVSAGIANGHTYVNPNSYTIKVSATTDKGCKDSLTLPTQVVVNKNPKADFSFTPLEPSNITEYVTFKDSSSLDVIAWDWITSDGGIYSGSSSVNHSFADSGSYFVTLTATNANGCQDDITKLVYVNADLFVHLPNAFTPNGDPLNSHFGLSGITQGVSQFKMMIYNRWGQQVFYSEDVNIKWDGTFLGKPAEQGVYVYRMEYTNPKQTQWYYFNGEVNLLR